MYIHPILLAEGTQKVLDGTQKLNGTQIAAMTLVGLLVVFSALLILVLFLTCSGSIFKKTGKNTKPAQKKPAAAKPAPAKTAAQPAKKPAKPAAASKPKPAPAPAPAAAADDDEVIAVIMAAIAAMNAADGTNYQLRSVKQVTRGGAGRSAWAQAGLIETTKPFSF